ncbi:MAG TPA: NAD(P)-binding domain-containing protein [Acidimicrobiales bacterium]|nr:NAD(P)-binding domain-containing protein [Acidimicrobiales bacterium]
MNVGIIGLGQMGMPILERLRAAGHEVFFRARRPEVAEVAAGLGATAVEDFSDCAVVIICVYDDEQVREIAPPVIGSMAPGATLVNHTTGSPATAELLESLASRRKVRVLDAALSGSPAQIAAGNLTLMIGGDQSVLDGVRPVLASYSDPILHVGRIGDGQRVKLVNNALFGAQLALVAEAERVATALGVDAATALGALQHCSGDSRVLRTVLSAGSAARLKELAGRFIQKDVAVVEAGAREEGVDLGRLGTGIYRLADVEAIEQLKARYFRFIDTKDWSAFRELFTEDCKHYLPRESPVSFVTNDEYFATMEGMLNSGITTHHCHKPEITFLSDTEAEGTWSMFDYVQVDPPSGRVSSMGYGLYLETYRKCADGKWRISSKRNKRLRLDQVPWTLPEPT